MTRKILILYASYGNGHYQVSRAIKEGFSCLENIEIQLLDLFEEAHPWINSITRSIYNKSFSFASFLLYGWTYYLTRNMTNRTVWSHWFHSFGSRKLLEIIQTEQPDLVINTFPMQALPELRRSKGIRIPNVIILTDFCLHNRWIHNEIDRYYVPTQDLMEDLVAKGISPQKILVSGIPIFQEFTESHVHKPYREFLGFSTNRKLVVVMGSSFSKNVVREVCQPFLFHSDVDVALVCGKNEALKKEMDTYFQDSTNIHVLGFVEHISKLMKIASFIITKAGGITLSEALAVNLPVLIFQPIPGQEAENARYLSKKGAAITVYSREELKSAISQLLYDEPYLSQMRKVSQSLQKPEAAKTIVYDIVKQMNWIEEGGTN